VEWTSEVGVEELNMGCKGLCGVRCHENTKVGSYNVSVEINKSLGKPDPQTRFSAEGFSETLCGLVGTLTSKLRVR
jgi:hypothetical protein